MLNFRNTHSKSIIIMKDGKIKFENIQPKSWPCSLTQCRNADNTGIVPRLNASDIKCFWWVVSMTVYHGRIARKKCSLKTLFIKKKLFTMEKYLGNLFTLNVVKTTSRFIRCLHFILEKNKLYWNNYNHIHWFNWLLYLLLFIF